MNTILVPLPVLRSPICIGTDMVDVAWESFFVQLMDADQARSARLLMAR